MPTPLTDPAYLADLLQHILDTACDCLEDTPLGRPKFCFVSHGVPPDDCCDFLTVWMVRQYPTKTFPIFLDERSKPCEPVRPAVEIELRLVRDCYPVVKDNANDPYPNPVTEIDPAAKDLLIDARVLWCCLQQAYDEGVLYPADMECLDVKWGEMVFHGPEGGCAGWKWKIILESDPCC